MNVTVSSRRTVIDEASREQIRGRISLGLRRFTPRIDEVRAQLEEVQRPGGGTQKLCRLAVRVKRLGSFAVETIEDDGDVAVSRAAERAVHRMHRLLDRQREERSTRVREEVRA